ncbi:MAG: BatA domain-containing protein [bacterium]|nr:BatA domain-containing protein [bacterium]
MSFLNATLLTGGLAFLIPLCIHLLNRTRVRHVDWGAMHLLQAAIQQNHRSLQWKSWLLLLLRCCIPILLALCLARPVLTSIRSTWAQGAQSLLFLVDDSLSMGQIQAQVSGDGISFLSSMADQCASIAASQPDSEKHLWTTSCLQDARPLTSTKDPQELANALDQLRAEAGSLDPLKHLRHALEKLTAFSTPGRHLILASDFRVADWQAISDSDLESLRSLCETPEGPLQISLLSLAASTNSSNLSVRFSSANSQQAAPQQPFSLTVEITNHGSEDVEDVPLILGVDGQTVERRSVDIGAGDSRQLEFGYEFADAGWHYAVSRILEPSATWKDALDLDNQASLAFEIARRPRILIVNPDRGANSHYLELALAPFSSQQAEGNRYEVLTLAPEDCADRIRQLKPETVVLNGVPRLDQQATQELREFVQAGGGLLVFPSSDMDSDWYRTQSQSLALLPMQYGAQVESKIEAELKRQFFQVPDLQVFNGLEAGNLYELRFSRWRVLSPIAPTVDEASPADGTSSRPATILELTDGTPMVVSHRFGRGIVIQVASSLDERWGNLPQKPVFVPWLQQLLQSTLTRPDSANLRPDESAFLRLIDRVNSQRQVTLGSPRSIEISQLPDMKAIASRRIEAAERSLQLEPLKRVGLFRLDLAASSSENRAGQPLSREITPPLLSVNAAAKESELRQLSPQELRRLSNRLGANLLQSSEEFETMLNLHRAGREIWQPLIAVLLLLLFAESLLSRSITKGGSAA